jgi:hypothetical protein
MVNITLIVLACLNPLAHSSHVHLQSSFQPSSDAGQRKEEEEERNRGNIDAEPTLWSAASCSNSNSPVILGVSCLYEVSLTCLNYLQMTRCWAGVGFRTLRTTEDILHSIHGALQLVNITVCSYHPAACFPWLISTLCGLRYLRLFLHCCSLSIAFAFERFQQSCRLFCMSFLKATTYSIHDPSKKFCIFQHLTISSSQILDRRCRTRVAKQLMSISVHPGSSTAAFQFCSGP